ncbi:MAG: hypothetical protein RRY19_01775 [Clostridium sp.]
MKNKLNETTLKEYIKNLKALDSIKHKKPSNNYKEAFINKFNFYDESLKINYSTPLNSSCPHCKSTKFIRFGTFKDTQRYRCKDCLKTFSNNTNTSFSYSKKSPLKWNLYVSLMFSGHTIRSCASILEINIATSFSWRHKILTNLLKFNDEKLLTNMISISSFTSRENFKGCREILKKDREKVNILFAIDNNLNSFAAINNIGTFNVQNTYRLLCNRFNANYNLTSYQNRLLNPISNYFSIKNTDETFDQLQNNKELLNAFRFNIKTWTKKFKGIATKYLDRYLVWFAHIYKEFFVNKSLFLDLFNNLFNHKYSTPDFTEFY